VADRDEQDSSTTFLRQRRDLFVVTAILLVAQLAGAKAEKLAASKEFSLPGYFKEIAESTNRAMAASKKALHHAASGINAEAQIIKLIKKYVPVAMLSRRGLS